jgi:predicted ATPase
MLSAATYRLVEGLFEAEDRGQPDLKGIATPLTLYRVVKESEAHSRFEVVVRKGLTPLIGREHEFGLLRERWERVRDGAGQVVLLSGEPGIGKSRLVEALKEAIEHEGARCLELHCSPYAQNSALQPIIEHLQRVLQFRPADSPDEKLRKLIVGAHNCAPLQSEEISLLAALLSLPHAEGYPPITLSPQKQKEKTYAVLVSWLYAEARQHAVTYAWEDLHWADPSTLELLTLFLAQVPTARLLAVLTFRPEFVPPWGAHSYLGQVTLSRLGRNHVETMVNHVVEQALRPSTLRQAQDSGRAESDSDGKSIPVRAESFDRLRTDPVEARTALPSEVVQQIVIKTDGVPLFIEELTKAVVESVGAQHAAPTFSLGIPSTLQDALMARLDRLGTAKEIAQLGATLGREFDYALLQAVSPLPEEALQQGLQQLVESELIYQSGLPPQARYLFKHALVQDTAYQSLLKSRRQQLHQQIAQVLEEKFPQTVEMQPELTAHHYTGAGLTARAIPYWQRAGERATQRSAYVEASNHLTKGLELLKALPDTPERVQQELPLQLALSTALIAVKSYTALEVENAVNRARALCQQMGESPQLFAVLIRLFLIYSNRRELPTARELAAQMMHLAQSIQDQFLLSIAHSTLGVTLYLLGELRSAWTHYEQALALYDPQRRSLPSVSTADLRVDCLSWESYTLWHLGYPEQALKRSQEAIALAEELSHPFSLAYALGGAAFFHALRREGQLAQERAEASITLANEHGFPYWLTFGMVVRGWALTLQGQVEKGIAQMQQGLAAYKTTGAGLARPSDLAPLAEAYGKIGQPEEGLTLLAEALATVDRNEERRHEAELYRLKGELTLQSSVQRLEASVQGKAEECFLKAIEIARKQQAKSLELRAAMSLARLWQQQGKQEAAHKLLSDIYNWFTEGFDTKDLREARTLIEELSD